MKVLFLDIDGVLNSKIFLSKNASETIDRYGVILLKKLIDKSGAVVVMSSGWRLWFDDNMIPEDGDAQYLYDILFEFDIKMYSKTPDFSTDEIRKKRTFSHVKAKEIKAWLDKNINVDEYVVLDDLDLKNEEINEHSVRINSQVGIMEDDVQRAVDILTQ